jgi:phosphoglycolate phosphatase
MHFKAVLFDLDGTLLNTIEDIAAVANRILKVMNCPQYTIDEYKYLVGDGTEVLARRVLPEEHFDQRKRLRFITYMKNKYLTVEHKKACPYPGITDLLDAMQARSVAAAVLSNKRQESALGEIERLLPQYRFAAVLGARDGVPLKPDPTAAQEVAQRLNVPTNEIIFLCDTGTDMKTATACGMYPVGVLWGFRDKQELEECGARQVIAHPMELVRILDGG